MINDRQTRITKLIISAIFYIVAIWLLWDTIGWKGLLGVMLFVGANNLEKNVTKDQRTIIAETLVQSVLQKVRDQNLDQHEGREHTRL